MFEKNLKIGYLLDFYGSLLSEKKRTVLDRYYNDDLSLSEIAEELGISRQGVRELIKHSEEELFFYEENLRLAEKAGKTREASETLLSLLKEQGASKEILAATQQLLSTVNG
ncbi:MAG: hypothetical protein IJR88_00965 [Clostridia bacterium]|nr:hypothetical protein [Clostridia bacterium]